MLLSLTGSCCRSYLLSKARHHILLLLLLLLLLVEVEVEVEVVLLLLLLLVLVLPPHRRRVTRTSGS